MTAEKNLRDKTPFRVHSDHRDRNDTLSYTPDQSCPLPRLSSVEIDVLRGIAEGLSDGQVAALLCRSTHTIRSHRDNLFNKIGVSNRVELTRFAIAMGHVPSTWRGMPHGESSTMPRTNNAPSLRRTNNTSDTRESNSRTAPATSRS